MRNVKNIRTGLAGVTVGARKDGSVAVLSEDESLVWYKVDEFASKFKVV